MKAREATRSIRTAPLPSVAGFESGAPAGPEIGELYGGEYRRLRERQATTKVSYPTWIRRTPEPKTGPLDWHHYPFQVEMHSTAITEAEEVCVRKCTQVGVSAWLERQLIYYVDVRGATAIYVFPNSKVMYDFSDSRVKKMIQASPYLSGRLAGVDNKGLKEIGLGTIYFRGSESIDDLESVDADIIGLDEYDRLVPLNIPIVENRVSGPQSLGLIRRVGVPIVPGGGISRQWRNSDRRRWFVRCEHCQKRQYLTWQKNVDQKRAVRICMHCQRELSPEVIRRGEWVKEQPDSAIPGFHISKLVVPDLRQAQLAKMVVRSHSRLPEDIQSFWNRDMGEGYAPEEGRLSDAALAAATSAGEDAGATAHMESYVGLNMTTMGVDVASVRDLNVRISEWIDGQTKRCIALKRVSSFDDLIPLMARFQIKMAVIDHAPDGRLSRAFAHRFPGRVYTCAFSQNMLKLLNIHKDEPTVTVRRTEMIDSMLGMIRGQRNLLAPDAPADYGPHLQSLVRIQEKDHKGRRAVFYITEGDADDWAFAEVFDALAGDLMLMHQGIRAFEDSSLYRLEDRMEFQRSGVVEDADDPLLDLGTGGRYSTGFEDEEYNEGV